MEKIKTSIVIVKESTKNIVMKLIKNILRKLKNKLLSLIGIRCPKCFSYDILLVQSCASEEDYNKPFSCIFYYKCDNCKHKW